MRRGDLYRVYKPGGDSKRFRAFVVVSRQPSIDSNFSSVICAPVLTNAAGLSTQVSVGIDEGLKHDSWIFCDGLTSIRKSELTNFVGPLSPGKLAALDQALKRALGLH
jgi:mRNA interferase MazF